MTKVRFTLKALTLMAFMLAFSALANAQATRTWVSGVGDDVNPCSRTAPCKTFAGAISKTFINGEIDALDPGGFGTLTITKSITIDGGTGSGWASVLASGAPAGFTVNIANSANDPQKTVRLRHISINGTGASGTVGTRTGTNGINVSTLTVAGTTVIVQEVVIDSFVNNGINGTFSSGGNLIVEDSYIQENGKGIFLSGTSGFVIGNVRNTRIQRNGTGVDIGANGFATMTDCNVSANTGDGAKTSSGVSQLNVAHSLVANNGTVGLNASIAGSTVRSLSNHILNNGGAAYGVVGSVETDTQNRVKGNGSDNAPNGGSVVIN